ncbi:MAG: hypothetical protein J3K34DRAFT_521703 [Monoraphidium minutum]|nr:MAG: hypothetical protein J3K34DRAFT_521703 [Monoraphidium minutum]
MGLRLLLCLAAATLLGAASASRMSPAVAGDWSGGARQLLQLTDCSKYVPNCATCRFAVSKGSTATRAVCLSCNNGYLAKAAGRACCCPNKCDPCGKSYFCAGAKSTEASGASRIKCGANKVTTTELGRSDRDCVVLPGYAWAMGEGSTQCLAGFYNPGYNTRRCNKCPGGLTTAGPGAAAPAECVAPPGYYKNGGRAVACARGSYKTALGNTDCTECPEGFTTVDGQVAKKSPSDCKYVKPGFGAADDLVPGSSPATPCPADKYRSGDALFTTGTAVACTPCPSGMRTLPEQKGATTSSACLAPPGYGFNTDSGDAAIITTDGAGASDENECYTPAGHGTARALDGALSAGPCAVNTYGSPDKTHGLNDVECTKCPRFTHTLGDGKTEGSDCLTDPGYGEDGACDYAYFQVGNNQMPCTYCGDGYNTTAPGAYEAGQCLVDYGYTPARGGAGGVEPCLRGTYKSTLGDAACTVCPSGTTTSAVALAATAESDCDACRPGFGAASINLAQPECAACESGTWSGGRVSGGAACEAYPKPDGYTGRMVSRRGIASPESCLQEFSADASMASGGSFDLIPMAAASLTLDASKNIVDDCQAGCTGRCQYYNYFDYKTPGERCYYRVAAADIARVSAFDADTSYVLFEVKEGKYVVYEAESAADADAIGVTIATTHATRAAATAACDGDAACAGVSYAAGAAAWRTFGGQAWAGGVGRYGGPSYFTDAFDAARGLGSFGILEQGSCGFTNSDGSLPFPRGTVAAAADTNSDYAGSCNRCYGVRCTSGIVLANDGRPLNWSEAGAFYLTSVSRTLPDTSGRLWPGNDVEELGLVNTQCWDESREQIIRVIDTCPCRQVLPDGAPGVAPGGEVRRQEVCCGGPAGITHFDISFYGFEQLAHPLYGQQARRCFAIGMLEYRPVDCTTGLPVPPSYVDRTAIYRDGARDGWAWFVYSGSYFQHAVPGASPSGDAATCVELTAGGGLTFQVKRGGGALQPFGGADTLRFQLRAGPPPPARAAARLPDLKIFVLNEQEQRYCNNEVFIRDLANSSTPLRGGWAAYRLPFSALRCDYEGALPDQVDRVDIQNASPDSSAAFCLANFEIAR